MFSVDVEILETKLGQYLVKDKRDRKAWISQKEYNDGLKSVNENIFARAHETFNKYKEMMELKNDRT